MVILFNKYKINKGKNQEKDNLQKVLKEKNH